MSESKRESYLIGDGVSMTPLENGEYDLHVRPAIRQASSTGKSDILAKTTGGYAALGANRKIMVVLIETKPKKPAK